MKYSARMKGVLNTGKKVWRINGEFSQPAPIEGDKLICQNSVIKVDG